MSEKAQDTHASSATEIVDWSAYLLAMQTFQASSSNKYRKRAKEKGTENTAPKEALKEAQPEAPATPEVEVVQSDATVQEHEDTSKPTTDDSLNPQQSPGKQVNDIVVADQSVVNENNKVPCCDDSANIPQPVTPPAVKENMAFLNASNNVSAATSPRQHIGGRGLGSNAEKQSYIDEKEIEPEESKSPTMRPDAKEESSDDDSNGSDEVIFRQNELNMVGPRINASAFRHGRARLVNASSTESQKENKPPVQNTPARNGSTATMTRASNQGRPRAVPERATRQNRQNTPQAKTPAKETKNKRNVKEELRQLQQAEMIKFGRKQMGLDPEANPKTGSLYLARQGPGTDPKSPFTQGLEKLIAGAPDPLLLKDTQDTTKVEGGSPVPSGSTSSGPKRVTSDEPKIGEGLEIKKWAGEKEEFSPMVVDWQYRPWETYGDEHFVRNFRTWLENTMRLGYPVDMQHESFRNGTSIPDGINGMTPASFEVLEARVDPTDADNLLHAHEAAAGYVHNWNLRLEQEATEKEQQRLLQKQAVKTPMITVTAEEEPNPYAPKAKVYLRPVEDKDVPALVALYNWYIKNTVRCVDLEEITPSEMKEQIYDVESERLPFVVAAEHKPHHGHAMNGQEEMIYGYASVCDFTGPKSTQRCSGEIELFVHPKMQRSGIGRCLLDKVVEICDPKYPAKRGYSFDCAPDKRHIYCAGNNRLLSRLILIIHHLADDPADYKWIKAWLEKEFRFEEQGVLKGVGAKKGKLLNSGYLVCDTSVKHKRARRDR